MAKKDIEQMDVEAGDEDAGVARIYELAFHLDPELSESEAKKAYGGYKDLISENGTVVAEGEPEKIQLAYTISRNENAGRRDFTSAYFCWIAYEAMGAGHEAVADAARCRLPRRLKDGPVQRAPRRGVVMPPGRVPGPPERGVTSPARRRRANRSRFPGLVRKACARSPARRLPPLRLQDRL